jgi:hypothetical protein
LRWLQRYIDERLPPLAEVALEIRQMLLDSVGRRRLANSSFLRDAMAGGSY